MSRLFERLREEKETGHRDSEQSFGKPKHNNPETMQALFGNVREWLKDGEMSGILNVSGHRVKIRGEHSGIDEVDGLRVDFGCGRQLNVEPVAGTGLDGHVCVAMRFQGCRKTGNIQLQHRGDRWLIWPKNSVRQQPVLWSSKIFLDLLDEMV